MPDLILPTNGETPAVQQPQALPPPNYAIGETGMVITIAVAPGTAVQHAIPAQIMHEIMKKWREIERANAGMMQVAQEVIRTKQRGG